MISVEFQLAEPIMSQEITVEDRNLLGNRVDNVKYAEIYDLLEVKNYRKAACVAFAMNRAIILVPSIIENIHGKSFKDVIGIIDSIFNGSVVSSLNDEKVDELELLDLKKMNYLDICKIHKMAIDQRHDRLRNDCENLLTEYLCEATVSYLIDHIIGCNGSFTLASIRGTLHKLITHASSLYLHLKHEHFLILLRFIFPDMTDPFCVIIQLKWFESHPEECKNIMSIRFPTDQRILMRHMHDISRLVISIGNIDLLTEFLKVTSTLVLPRYLLEYPKNVNFVSLDDFSPDRLVFEVWIQRSRNGARYHTCQVRYNFGTVDSSIYDSFVLALPNLPFSGFVTRPRMDGTKIDIDCMFKVSLDKERRLVLILNEFELALFRHAYQYRGQLGVPILREDIRQYCIKPVIHLQTDKVTGGIIPNGPGMFFARVKPEEILILKDPITGQEKTHRDYPRIRNHWYNLEHGLLDLSYIYAGGGRISIQKSLTYGYVEPAFP